MPIPSVPPFLPGAIGEAADVLDIEAETPPGSGALSYKSGWPALTALPLEAGGIAPQREYFNAVNKLLSQHTRFQQAGAVYPWSNTLDYPVNAHVEGSDGETYMALKPSGPDTPNPDGGGMVGPVDPVGDESGHWIKLSLLYGGMPNSEKWITESGEWEAPVDGWYSLLLFSGGNSAVIETSTRLARGGASGPMAITQMYLSKGQQVPVIIGAGGVSAGADTATAVGGVTSFGDFSATRDTGFWELNGQWSPRGSVSGITTYYGAGGGFGGGYPSQPQSSDTQAQRNANCSGAGHHGGGGAAIIMSNGLYGLGTGAPGSILARWHDPAKAAGPLPAPALLSARRMASRAADAPTTVNLYDLETGQGSVWREEDAPAQLERGLITQEAWLEICAAKAAEERALWLVSPDTCAERYDLLRAARDARLAATDYLTAADYPLADDARAKVTAYRQALRDLPVQPGAPWDGGGEATPWPEKPANVKA